MTPKWRPELFTGRLPVTSILRLVSATLVSNCPLGRGRLLPETPHEFRSHWTLIVISPLRAGCKTGPPNLIPNTLLAAYFMVKMKPCIILTPTIFMAMKWKLTFIPIFRSTAIVPGIPPRLVTVATRFSGIKKLPGPCVPLSLTGVTALVTVFRAAVRVLSRRSRRCGI